MTRSPFAFARDVLVAFVMVLVVACGGFGPTLAYALGVPDDSRDGSLVAEVAVGGMGVAGMGFSLARVAAFDEAGQLVLEPAYEGAGVDVTGLSTAGEWRSAADGLATWADAQGLAADATGETGVSGRVRFSALEPGLYLLRGSDLTASGKVYSCGNTLVSVPSAEGDAWSYDVTCELKVSVADMPAEPGSGDGEKPADSDDSRGGDGSLAGTGDTTSMAPVIACVAAGCAPVAAAVIARRRRK